MGELSAGWREFLSLLIAPRVRFVVVGGHAVAVHAEPRFTQDLDPFVAATKTNAKAIRRCRVDLGFGDATPSLAVLATPHKVFMLGRVPYRIDLLTAIDGVTFRDAEKTAVIVRSEAGPLPVISRELLIQNKTAAGRLKDLVDLEVLQSFGGSTRPRSRKRTVPRRRRSGDARVSAGRWSELRQIVLRRSDVAMMAGDDERAEVNGDIGFALRQRGLSPPPIARRDRSPDGQRELPS